MTKILTYAWLITHLEDDEGNPLPCTGKLRHTIEPQQWWLGDPCYLFDDPVWMQMIHRVFHGNDYGIMEVTIGETVWSIPWTDTYQGDGEYPVLRRGLKIGDVGVDAGMVAAIPTGLLDEVMPGWRDQDVAGYGVITDEGIGGALSFFPQGNLNIGAYSIITDEDYIDEDGDDEDDDYDG